MGRFSILRGDTLVRQLVIKQIVLQKQCVVNVQPYRESLVSAWRFLGRGISDNGLTKYCKKIG